MSKAKLVNECIKLLRAGIQPTLKAGPATPNSVPDKTAVGRFITKDGGFT